MAAGALELHLVPQISLIDLLSEGLCYVIGAGRGASGTGTKRDPEMIRPAFLLQSGLEFLQLLD